MDALMQYGGSDDEEEGQSPPPSPPPPFPTFDLPPPPPPPGPSSPSTFSLPPPPFDPPSPPSPSTSLTSSVIHKVTSQIESVVNNGLIHVSTAPSSLGKQKFLPRPIHQSLSQSSPDLYVPPPQPTPTSPGNSPPPIPHPIHVSHSFSDTRPHSAPPTPILETKNNTPLSHSQSNVSRPRSSSQSLLRSHPHPPSNANPHENSHAQNHKHCHSYYSGPIKKVVNMDEWDKTYQKWKSIEDEKAEKIKSKKEEKRKAEMAEASFKPRISKTSEKMVNNRENIVERMVNRKAETDKKLEQLRKLQEDMILSAVKAIPTINQTSHKMQRPRGVMEQWVRERDKKLDVLRTKQKEQEEEELKEYFKPKLNSKSLDLLSKKEGEKQDVAIRLSEQIKKRTEKLEEMRKNNEFPHKPQINSRSKNIKLATPVHERLYKVGMDSITEKHKFLADNWDFSFTTRKPLGLEVEPNATTDVPSSSSPSELHTSLDAPFENGDLLPDAQHGYHAHDDVADYNGVNWPPMHEYENVVWQQHQDYVAGFGGAGNGVYAHQPAYDQLVEEDLEYYYHAANNNGYDEDLRRMMMEAGFFQSSHAYEVHNSANDQQEQEEEEYFTKHNPYLVSPASAPHANVK